MSLKVLLVTENPLSAADVAAVTSSEGTPPGEQVFYVAVPRKATARSTQSVIDGLAMDVTASRGEAAIDLPDDVPDPKVPATDDAQHVLDEVTAALTAAGAQAEGEVTPRHPLETIGDIVEAKGIDEVVVMVSRPSLRGLLHADLAARIKRHFDVPALRVHSHD